VDNDGNITLARGAKLSLEDFNLHVAWRVVVVKVETNLTPRYHAFVLDQRFNLLFRTIIVEACIVRMCADSCVYVGVCSAKLDGAFQRTAVRIARTNVKNKLDTSVLRSPQHLFAIGVKFRPVNVRV
jgi:hypothetical protein